MLNRISGVTSAKFAIPVLMEFVIFIPITYFAAERQSYALFIGVNALMLVHVLTHAGQAILLRAYTPGVVTCLLIVPYTLYLFSRMLDEGLVTLAQIYYAAPLGLFVIPLVVFGHWLAGRLLRES